jgi:hypothetical protein
MNYFRVFLRRVKKVFWKEELILTTVFVLALGGFLGFLVGSGVPNTMLAYSMLEDITSLKVHEGFLMRVVVALIGFVSSMWPKYGNVKLVGYCIVFGFSTILAGTFILTKSMIAAGGWTALTLVCIPALFLSTPDHRLR